MARQYKGGGKRPGRVRPFRRGPGGKRPFRTERAPRDLAILYGWHPVLSALENPARRVRRLLATENGARRLEEAGVSLKSPPEIVRPETIAGLLSPDAVHQGLYLETDLLPVPGLDEVEPGTVLMLDQVTDPHNFGAIVRTASAFAVSAIVTTARHSPEATGVLAKSASGGLEHVPLVLVQNLARAMTELKERGFLLVGLAEEGGIDLADAPLRAPVALVIGAEGKGLRQLTRETCDVLARIDLPGAIKSLNVSNATAVALQMVTRRLAADKR
jgi:23S rRNA (guanosine2251-2'-O)-methyltransferase